ncbi:MAG: 23S rRNA (guanosine(2251)-2'-O)-methyltransferase RlmB [Flavobacteriaceae bacterium]|nr:23S rRNA (guanosine(2251)-2'-O)-methyltransferase RlmB [Flavobacteriaceae bacterium]|tara:strand:+ start:14086 stop:14823 length:738 start_codon:yes stop_codon:yes gene_type:complete
MENSFEIYGIHSIIEAIESGVNIEKVWLKKGKKGYLFQRLEKSIRDNKISFSYVPEEKLNKLKTKNHQGAVALISKIAFFPIEKIIEEAFQVNLNPTFVLLDRVTDSRNLGAILRSCAAASVNGVIIPQTGSALINDLSIKTSSGGIFKVPITKVKHLKDAIYILKSYDVEIIAVSEKSNNHLFNSKLNHSSAFLLGSEDKGIDKGLIKLCDKTIKIPMYNLIDSLNVSVTTGIVLYEKIRQNLF